MMIGVASSQRKRDAFLLPFYRVKAAASRASVRPPTAAPRDASNVVASPHVDRLHEEAFKEFRILHPQDAEILEPYIDPRASSKWHDEATAFIQARLDEAKANQLKVRLHDGKVLIIGDILGKLTQWVRMMVTVGDAAVQFDPVHAALPWTALRFVLQSSLNYQEAESAVWGGIESVCTNIVWVSLQEILFLDSTLRTSPQLRKAFMSFYMELFIVLARYLKQLDKSRGARLLLSPFVSKSSFEQYLTKIEQAKRTIEAFSQQVMGERQIEQSANIKKVLDHLDDLKSLEVSVTRLQITNERIYSRSEEQTRQSLLDWISDIQQVDHFSRMSSKALSGTGKWFIESEQYNKWRYSSTAEILRLHGKSGSGKSTLFSILLKQLQQEAESDGLGPPIYFYCARTSEEPKRSQALQILRCLLKQLSELPGSNKTQNSVLERYEQRRLKGELQEKDVIDLCLSCIETRGMTYILVDALDESDPTSRDVLLGGLLRLLRDSVQLVKIFVTSRDPRYEGMMLQYPELRIMPQDNKSDIVLYVDTELRRMTREKLILNGDVSPGLSDHIRQRLCEKADGMFRWVAVQLQTLKHIPDESLIRRRLGSLTTNLSKTYEDLFEFELKHLDDYNPDARDVALRTFKWLIVAQEKLSTSDFCKLVGHVGEDGRPNPVENLLQYCFSLVEYDRATKTLRFCHLSVREFFESPGFKEAYPEFQEARIHASVAVTCLNLIHSSRKKNRQPPDYAVWYWAYHAWQAGEQRTAGKLKEEVRKFLRDAQVLQSWKSLVKNSKRVDDINSGFHGWSLRDPWPVYFNLDCTQPLWIIVMWNFFELVPIFSEGESVETLAAMLYNTDALGEDSYIDPLEYFNSHPSSLFNRHRMAFGLLECAADRGHLEVLQALFDLGMGVTSTEFHTSRALLHASAQGHGEVVQLLLEQGTRVYSKEDIASSLMAIDHGKEDNPRIVQLLLDFGAGVDSQTFTKALAGASGRGLSRTVELLLDWQADTGFRDGGGKEHALLTVCGPLRYPYRYTTSHDEVARLLLQHGADAGAQNDEGRSALMAASEHGRINTVRLLLDNEADVCILDMKGRDAIQLALAEAKHSVARMLVDHRIDTGNGFEDEEICSLANAAVSGGTGCREMLESLSERGFCVDFKFTQAALNRGLGRAAEGGVGEEVLFLIDHGAIVDSTASNYDLKTALISASAEGHLAVVEILLNRGADVNLMPAEQSSWEFRTNFCALSAAANAGHVAVMELLLARGADPNLKHEYGTSLIAAITRIHVPAVELLLKAGADTNAVTRHGETALWWAIEFANHPSRMAAGGKLVKLLLEHGAKINVTAGRRYDIFATAMTHHDTETVKLLLESNAAASLTPDDLRHPLILAAENGQEDIIRLLLKHNADVRLEGPFGQYGEDLYMVYTERGLAITTFQRGTALAAAASQHCINSMALLASEGADVNAGGKGSSTALEAALQRNDFEHEMYHSRPKMLPTIEWLLQHGADPMLRTKWFNALDFASRMLDDIRDLLASPEWHERLEREIVLKRRKQRIKAELITQYQEAIAVLKSHGAENSEEYLHMRERRKVRRQEKKVRREARASLEVDGLNDFFDMADH